MNSLIAYLMGAQRPPIDQEEEVNGETKKTEPEEDTSNHSTDNSSSSCSSSSIWGYDPKGPASPIDHVRVDEKYFIDYSRYLGALIEASIRCLST